MANTAYVTNQGDRWDSIAQKAYGDATMFNDIVSANPFVPNTLVFEAGIKLQIPIIETENTSIVDLLPPWKRVDTTAVENANNQVEEQKNFLTNPSYGGSFDKSFD